MPRSVSSIKQGYIFVHEKSKIPSTFFSIFKNQYNILRLGPSIFGSFNKVVFAETIGRDVLSNRWTMYYCVFQKETRIFTMIPVNNTARTVSESFCLKTEMMDFERKFLISHLDLVFYISQSVEIFFLFKENQRIFEKKTEPTSCKKCYIMKKFFVVYLFIMRNACFVIFHSESGSTVFLRFIASIFFLVYHLVLSFKDMKGALGQSVSFKLKTCTRRASDSIDKRFFFFEVRLLFSVKAL